jgi:hypothetical protein
MFIFPLNWGQSHVERKSPSWKIEGWIERRNSIQTVITHAMRRAKIRLIGRRRMEIWSRRATFQQLFFSRPAAGKINLWKKSPRGASRSHSVRIRRKLVDAGFTGLN